MVPVCRPRLPKIEPGYSFGQYVVVRYLKNVPFHGQIYECRCSCGNLVEKRRSRILSSKGAIGCSKCPGRMVSTQRERIGPKIFDLFADRFYAARSRCEDPLDPNYDSYGGRGIRCLFENAEDYVVYCIDVLRATSDFEIDRRDNNGHYAPGNLRLADRSLQTNNTRISHAIRHRGRLYGAEEFRRMFAPKYRDASTVARKARAGKTAREIIDEQESCRGEYDVRHIERRSPPTLRDLVRGRPANRS